MKVDDGKVFKIIQRTLKLSTFRSMKKRTIIIRKKSKQFSLTSKLLQEIDNSDIIHNNETMSQFAKISNSNNQNPNHIEKSKDKHQPTIISKSNINSLSQTYIEQENIDINNEENDDQYFSSNHENDNQDSQTTTIINSEINNISNNSQQKEILILI